MSAIESMDLTPGETALVQSAGADPSTYVALALDVQVNMQAPGQIMQAKTPEGKIVEIAVVQLLLTIPLANLRASSLLGANGEAPNPLEGMLPSLRARLVLPRVRVAPQVLQAIEASAPQDVASLEEVAVHVRALGATKAPLTEVLAYLEAHVAPLQAPPVPTLRDAAYLRGS